ncbi:GNAT family N-acetyltransferase [Enterococcus ureilyticus]|uniref:GNAT family N-acetyltransferase n=1 Tax=Enterococcus ureilyticus TaxID=1131292 RepID=A0A1E5HBX4_9ENTE|nr:GNAT family protein [Enterococcus ureilyticus]MBM7690245.1 ribosomal-protein-serine acetyltransferase [Enterococcus ureilyticus]OEG22447.1 GNAT family N-acetyltransferase [Enterococcus ureilyticus]
MKHYFYLEIDESLSLVQPTLSMAHELFEVIDSDRKHLRKFLDFVDTTTSFEQQEQYIKMKLEGYINETDRLFLIAFDQNIIGCIDLHFIDTNNKKAELGYWLHSSQTNKGIMSKVVKKVCAIAFEDMGLNKLSIRADTENKASNAVAVKNGFSFVGTDKSDIIMYDKFRDLNKYSLLKTDFS